MASSSLANQLIEARTKAGLSQNQLASRAGKGVRTVCNIEAGEPARIPTLRDIFDAIPEMEESEWPRWVASAVRLMAGEWADLLTIAPKGKREPVGELATKIDHLPPAHREVIREAIDHPHVLRALGELSKVSGRMERNGVVLNQKRW